MNSLKDSAKTSVAINMRVDESKRNLIDLAATMLGSDRTSFILNAACEQAEKVILDKQIFLIESSAFDAFEEALENNPIGENKCLMTFLSRPKRWT